MATTREQAWQALFSLLSNDAGVQAVVNSFSRRFMLPGEYATAEAFADAGGKLPLLMIRETDETTQQQGLTPAIREWDGWVVVYMKNDDKTVTGATVVNPIIDAIEAALNPTGRDAMLGYQTLGGLVYRVWISGQSFKETGDNDADGFGGCAIPIKIKVP